MKLHPISLRKTLNPAYRKQKVSREEIEQFKQRFQILLEKVNTEESEENAKFHLTNFLQQVYYQDRFLVATKDRSDLVIHNGKTATSTAGVLIETKRPKTNGKVASDMVTLEQPNVKAFHEILLYYLRERIEYENTDIKYLIITDVFHWYIFPASALEQHAFTNKKLVQDYTEWRDGRKSGNTTDFFYQHIAKPFFEKLDISLEVVQVNLLEYQKWVTNKDDNDDHHLVPLYKLLSPEHLLKLPFANDSNSLNKRFYYELLHLIGLEEVKVKNKKVIRRPAKGNRHHGSLLENTIATLQSEDRLRRLPQLRKYGNTESEQLFQIALELCITWTNRLLFLKLLEAQLLKYHDGEKEYQFLNSSTLADFDEVQELFFDALAKKASERPEYAAKKFKRIPYLNSSLFERTELEDQTIRINSLKDRFDLPYYNKTVLKDQHGKRKQGSSRVLDYLFAFLNAYDFSSEGAEAIQEDNKSLINASVLGLIFEKINGYEDGAFFTPGFVTMYMCRETIRRAVVQGFSESDYFTEFSGEQFGELQNYLARKYQPGDIRKANEIINGLTICDPAVGSGHFLVSALNELLAIKSELGILTDRNGNPLPVRLEIANDELTVQWRRTDAFFEYRPGIRDDQVVQEALFHEKQYLIEHCLFGVDLNPNSVKICRLRLWIELLKNTYYIDSKVDRGLETLPNIDINIKQGNSLIHRFGLEEDLKPVLRKSKWTIRDYQIAVSSYQQAQSSEDKRALREQIDRIKSDFQTHIFARDPRVKRLANLRGKKFLLENQSEVGDLFEKLDEADITGDLGKVIQKMDKLEQEIEEIRNAVIFQHAFEWRFEFPEVLDEDGNFVGFDVIIGNPPYIRQEEFKEWKDYLKEHYSTYKGTADLLVYFVELSRTILRQGGHFSFIISNKFMRAGFGDKLRAWLQEVRLLEIVDFGDLPVFEEATTYPCILSWQKASPGGTFRAAQIAELTPEHFPAYLETVAFASLQSTLQPDGWTLADVPTQKLLEKLRNSGTTLGEYVDGKIYYGIKTGLNEAFVIDAPTRDRLIAEDSRSAEVIKPFLAGRDIKRYQQPVAEKYLIFARRGIDIGKYPAILRYLEAYRDRLEPRPKDWKGRSSDWPGRKPGSYKWYEIQDAVDYYEEFEKEKILYQVFQVKPAFVFDYQNFYTNNSIWILPNANRTLLAILNSKLGWFFIKSYCTPIQNGYQLISSYLMRIPIIDQRDKVAEKLTIKAEQKNKQGLIDEVQIIDNQIDSHVYKLYNLTYDEVLLVDPEFPLSQPAYERFLAEA